MPRYIGRDNVRKLLVELGQGVGDDEARTVYQDGRARFELAAEIVTVTPPFGLAHEGVYRGLAPEPLYQALFADHLVGILLVRLGGYAVSVLDGEAIVASKVGTRFVKNRHKKGGSSSNRFRRRRVEQAKDLVEEAAQVAERVLGPSLARLEALAVGGDKEAVRLTLAESPSLAALPRLERFLTTEDPRQRVLEQVAYDVYAAQVERTSRPRP